MSSRAVRAIRSRFNRGFDGRAMRVSFGRNQPTRWIRLAHKKQTLYVLSRDAHLAVQRVACRVIGKRFMDHSTFTVVEADIEQLHAALEARQQVGEKGT